MCSAPVSSLVSPKLAVPPSAQCLSMTLPTVGQLDRPVVVSDSPHLTEMYSSLKLALRALQLGGPLDVFLGLVRRGSDGLDVAVAFDGEAGDGLAGLGDAVDDAPGPTWLDADDDDGRDVGIRSSADHGAEVQLEVFAELQAAVRVGQGQGALDVVGHRLACGVGDIVHRKNDHVIAHADPPVFTSVSENLAIRHAYAHLFVLRFCVCTWCPAATS